MRILLRKLILKGIKIIKKNMQENINSCMEDRNKSNDESGFNHRRKISIRWCKKRKLSRVAFYIRSARK